MSLQKNWLVARCSPRVKSKQEGLDRERQRLEVVAAQIEHARQLRAGVIRGNSATAYLWLQHDLTERISRVSGRKLLPRAESKMILHRYDQLDALNYATNYEHVFGCN